MEKLLEKRLKVKHVKDLLMGKFDIDNESFRHLKSVGIFSCQSPTSAIIHGNKFEDFLRQEKLFEGTDEEVLNKWNEYAMSKARKLLKDYRFRVIDGLYGGHEKSFVVFDIERNKLEELNRKFFQQAYMYINLLNKVDPKVGSGLHFGQDADGKNVPSLTRRGEGNEASKNVCFMETWSRSDDLDADGSNIFNPYELMETSFGITLDDSYMKDPSNPTEEDKDTYQSRIDNNLGFSAKYTAYGDDPKNYEGDPMNLKPIGESILSESDFKQIYESCN